MEDKNFQELEIQEQENSQELEESQKEFLEEEEFNESDEEEELSSSKKRTRKKSDKVSDFYLKKISELENELSAYKSREQSFKDEWNKKYLDAIQKKGEEAVLLLEEKEKKIEQKYSLKFEELRDFMYEKQFTELVNIISGMEKVLSAEPKSEEIKNYLLGFKMFLTQFEFLLESLSIKTISPEVGQEYNSEQMESLETEAVEEQEKKNKIIEVFSKGYTLNSRVIKLAQVKVGV